MRNQVDADGPHLGIDGADAMDLLVVAPSLPYPPDSAQRLRTWHLVRRLAYRHRVTLLTWAPNETPQEHLDIVERSVHELHVAGVLPFRRRVTSRVRRHLRFLSTAVPSYVQAMVEARGLDRGGPGHRFVRDAMTGRRFDAVVLEEESAVAFPLPSTDAPVVVHRLNVFERVIADVRIEHPLRRLAKPLEMRAWRRFDAEVGRAADHLITPTPEASRVVSQISPGIPVDVVTSGVELPNLSTRPSEGTDLVFVGWMSYPPNVDAVRWFVREIWPTIHRAAPATRFRIIGREPAAEVEALVGDGVVVTGEVPDVVEACRGARAAVVPLRGGMGIKTKTVEFMAMGLPVVSTTVGAEGIAADPSEGLAVHDDAHVFARTTVELLHNPSRADQLGDAAHAFARRRFHWDDIAAGYEQVLAGAARRTRSVNRPR